MMQGAVGDFPIFIDGGHTHSTYSMGNLAKPIKTLDSWTSANPVARGSVKENDLYMQDAFVQPKDATPKKEVNPMSRRIVQVFIADTDENVPLEKSVLYTGEQKLTDATDQELYFEISVKELLDKHNEYRKTLINKKIKERTEYLEPAKIRDLKMVVVTIASF